jgi:exopolyphosphatase/guanosine-5'-triphosphate,3'-diphosphate pyrophosphatase
MSEAALPPAGRIRDPAPATDGTRAYAALDLGTNNCRLLIATPSPGGFRILEAYSRIVRLGDGLSKTGKLSDEAMERALTALRTCAEKIRRRKVGRMRAVATQACRSARNGRAFVDRVAQETGIRLKIIPPREEAQLSVAGCLNLLDRSARAALVIDVGGGSTELSWVDLGDPGLEFDRRDQHPSNTPIRAWLSIPIGVVTLAEMFPEPAPGDAAWFREMVEEVKARIGGFTQADSLRPHFDGGHAHLVGTSGAITSLAGLHLNLTRYDRSRVDGLWMTRDQCEDAADRLLTLAPHERAAQPCIGPDRSDLVLAGAAILQAVQELWPCARVRVADRGLREGLLMSLMSGTRKRGRRRGRSRRRSVGASAPQGAMA